MGLRFRRRIRLGKGMWINVSRSGTSLSVGGRGATVNFGKKGTTTTLGIPGTGLSYRTTSARSAAPQPAPGQAQPGKSMWIRWTLLAFFAVTAAMAIAASFSQH